MKVLVVDDEAIIIEGLKVHIDWQAAGFHEWTDASNAKEAMEIIAHDQPDLIITDIFMPEMSGIDFAKLVRVKYPQIRFIILTGYEKFEYAKEAIEIGVLKYLVKPIFPDELRQVVEEARDDIINERRVQNWNENARLRLNQYKPVIIDKFWNDLLTSPLTLIQFQENAEGVDLDLPEGEISCAAFKIVDLEQAKERFSYKSKSLLKFMIRNVIEELLGSSIIYIVDHSPSILILILQRNTSSSQLESVSRAFHDVLKLRVSIGLGTPYSGILNAHSSFNEAMEAIRYLQMMDENGIIHFKDIPAWKKDFVEYPYKEEKEIVEMLRYRTNIGEEAIDLT
ncbi:response regulator [Paenibacillus frigoriresistens]|uniref:response regulator n=1 Tax=Paenibacillus alginolyticus TaxID=59839 RepID=UPI0015650B6E|nr:response regulator [Paenibacillus frigoriresistens]NRF96130.1 response regulator [Paenibacillus frigoriresistens]